MTIRGMPPARCGYSRIQIVLHWLVAGLVLVQLTVAAGWDGPPPEVSLATHAIVGTLVFILTIVRLAVRRRVGIPPHSRWSAPILARTAVAVHRTFYALLLGLPALGALGRFGGIPWLVIVHGLGAWMLAVLIIVHVGAAVLGQFVHHTGTLTRMVQPETRQVRSTR